MRNPFTYRGCTVAPERMPAPILAGCNGSVNRYLRTLWRVTFPDRTWVRTGTKNEARRYIDGCIYRHGAIAE